MRRNLLLNADISPDGVITPGGGAKLPPQPAPQATPQPAPQPEPQNEDKSVEPQGGKPADNKENLVDFDAFAALENEPTIKNEPKDDVKLKVKEEVKPADKPADKPVDKPADKVAGRDYSGIAEEHIPAFKKMSNEAFAAMKPIYLERQQAAAKLKEQEEQISKLRTNALPDSYYENKDAFILDPQYRQVAQSVQTSEAIVRHWKQQLINIEQGQDWIDLDTDPQTGKIVKSSPKAADAEARVNVAEYFNHAIAQNNRLVAQAEAIQNSFVTRSTEALNQIKVSEDAWFPAFKDEKHPLQSVVQSVKQKLPAALRSNPLAGPLAKALVVMSVMQKDIANYEAKAGQAAPPKPSSDKAPISPQQRQAGPTSSEMQAGGGKSSGDEEITFDKFENL